MKSHEVWVVFKSIVEFFWTIKSTLNFVLDLSCYPPLSYPSLLSFSLSWAPSIPGAPRPPHPLCRWAICPRWIVIILSFSPSTYCSHHPSDSPHLPPSLLGRLSLASNDVSVCRLSDCRGRMRKWVKEISEFNVCTNNFIMKLPRSSKKFKGRSSVQSQAKKREKQEIILIFIFTFIYCVNLSIYI